MSKYFPLLLIGSISSILFSSIAFAQAIDRSSRQSSSSHLISDQVSTQIPNIQGEWKMSIVGENLSPTYTLIQTGNTLTGTFRVPLGNLPLTGTITKDKKVNFSAKAGGMSLKFAGTVEGKTMKGVADIPMKGRKNWTATQ
jgi:hypothetical protein